ncbi:hypothetical protein PBRA_002140 [Plasmodiophora brassicae]|uniref:SET domain-containing protein n=1 Tax=Plasmodiophora brassicae TaxID=37360 RepID=A0A0G4J2D7_PLABS|nr:hypothetical protein PBRA_002140 [Plasmodiophora brassicae]
MSVATVRCAAFETVGRCLVAAQDFAPGDTCLVEAPILVGTWAACNRAFSLLDGKQRSIVLAFSGADDEEQQDDAMRIAKRSIPREDWTETTGDLIQILHNNSIDLGNGIVGLFALASLAAHHCRPNIEGTASFDGVSYLWTVRALRQIRKGEILGWNYNLSDRAMLSNTAVRRDELLELRGFLCRCDACTSLDYLRSFPCHKCQTGFVVGVDRGPSPSCSTCGAGLSDATEADERSLYFEMIDSERPDWGSLCDRAHASLGPYHSITGRCAIEAFALNREQRHSDLIQLFLSSPSMADAVTAKEYVEKRLQV